MAGIGTAAKNWKEEEQGIGTAATRVPGQDIGTQGVGSAATRQPGQDINQGIGTAATRQPQPVEYAAQPQNQPIQVMEGVTQGTQQKLQQAQQGYQSGAAAQQALQNLQNLQNSKPQGYNSQYAGQLDSILQQIQGQQPFKYEFNTDAMFRTLADRYTQDAKQASMNAMGQAAALTGGYGNTAAQMAGQQAYQEQIRGLYDRGMELQQQAYDRYQDQQADRYRQAQLLQGMDETAYGRSRDELGDWERERDYQTQRYDTEDERGYNRYRDDLNYYTQLAQIENADYRSEQERQEAIRQFQAQYDRGVFESDRAFEEQRRQADLDEAYRQAQMQENIRQFNESLDWDKMSTQQKYAYQTALAILENGQIPSEELLEAAGLSAEDAKKLMAQVNTGGGYNPQKETTQMQDPGNLYGHILAAEEIAREKADAAAQAAKMTPTNIVNSKVIDPNLQVPSYNSVAPARDQITPQYRRTLEDVLNTATYNLRNR